MNAAELEDPIARIHPTVSAIKLAVVDHYGLSLIDMVSQRRPRKVARPRQVAMYLAKHLTPLSLPNIGRHFGNRDHTTVIHACRQIERLIPIDEPTREAVEKIQQHFSPGEE